VSKAKQTVIVELAIDIAQELEMSTNSTVRKIDWVLENKPPYKKGEAERLNERAKKLTLAALAIHEALNDRANNIVKIGEKK
jgi:hypothetical protein